MKIHSPLLATLLCLSYLLLSACGQEAHPADDFSVWGIDVSRYQGDIDWPLVAGTGLEFAFVKATEGKDHADENFGQHWAALNHTSIRRGAYHYFKPLVDPQLQANNFLSRVGGLQPGDLPAVLDLEERGELPTQQFIAQVQRWLDIVEQRTAARPIIYTGHKFYNRHLAGHFKAYPIWVARYKKEKPLLADGHAFTFWQYTDSGSLPGIDAAVDINVFAGTSLDLARLAIAPLGTPAVTQHNKPEPSLEKFGLMATKRKELNH